MSNIRKGASRVVSVILSAVMALSLLSGTNLVLAEDNTDDAESKNLSEIIVENYGSSLSSAEIAVLESGALADEQYTYTVPDDETLIDIDVDAKTVAAVAYEDSEGNTWIPSAAVISTSQGDEEISLEEAADGYYTGSFEYDGDDYTVEVTYGIYEEIDEELLQKINSIIAASGDLYDVLYAMEIIYDQLSTIETVEAYIEEFYELTEEAGGIPVSDTVSIWVNTTSATGAAYNSGVLNLYEQYCSEDNEGHFDATNLLIEYGAASSKIQYLMENGTELQTEIIKLYESFDDIYDGLDYLQDYVAYGIINSDLVTVGLNAINNMCNAIKAYIGDETDETGEEETPEYYGYETWTALTNEALTGSSDLSALVELYSEGTLSSGTSEISAGDTLTIAETVIESNVSRYTVTVNITAGVITEADSNETTQLTYSASLNLKGGLTADEVENEIADAGYEEKALAYFETLGSYNVSEDYYNREVSGITETLESDITCTISYTPKSYTVTAVDEDGNTVSGIVTEACYGYQITLPVYSDSEDYVYDYVIGDSYYDQGSVYTVTGDTQITQSIGAPWESVTLNEIAAASGVSDEVAAILLADALESYNTYRIKYPTDDMVTLTIDSDGNYVVYATQYTFNINSNSSLSCTWIPSYATFYSSSSDEGTTVELESSADAVSSQIESGTYTGTTEEDCSYVVVSYTLDLSSIIDEDELLDTVNLPSTLVEKAEDQLDALSTLLENYDDYEDLNGEKNTIKTALNGSYETDYDEDGNLYVVEGSDELNDEIRAAGRAIVNNCYNDETGNLLIYEYLTEYLEQGLAWYYHQTEDGTYDNYEALLEQVTLFQENMHVLCDDELVFYTYLVNRGDSLEKYYDELCDVVEKIEGITLTAPDQMIDGTDDEALAALVELLYSDDELISAETYSSTASLSLVLTEDVTETDENSVKVTVSVQIKDENASTVKTYSANKVFVIGEDLTEDDIDALLAECTDQVTSPSIDYYTLDTSSSTTFSSAVVLNGNVTYTYVYTPTKYTVYVDGEDTEITFYSTSRTITLPSASEDGYRYDYYLDGTFIGSGGSTYTFSTAQLSSLFEDYSLTLTVDKVNEDKEDVLTFIEEINEAFSGLTYTDKGNEYISVAMLPYEDENEDIDTIVLRITTSGSIDWEDLLGDVAEALINSDYENISFGTGGAYTFINKTEGQTYVDVSALLEVILNSGLDLTYFAELITDEGDLNEDMYVDLTGLTTALTGVDEDGNYTVENAIIREVENAGANLIETTISLDGKEYTFYVTMEDFDRSADSLQSVDDVVSYLDKYIDLAFEDGKIVLDVNNLPNKAYMICLAELLITGNADINDINNISAADLLSEFYALIEDIVYDEDISGETIENTMDELGFADDIQVVIDNWDTIQDVLSTILDLISYDADDMTEDTQDGVSYCSQPVTISLQDYIVDLIGEDSSYISNIKTSDIETSFDFSLTLKEYTGLIIDTSESGVFNIVTLKQDTDCSDWAEGLGDHSIIILLDDVSGSISTSSTVYIDLNGKELDGSISGSNITLVDSTLDNSGEVTGSIDVKRDARENSYYELSTDDDGNITLAIQASLISDEDNSFTDIKTLAFEVLFDLVINGYTNSSITVGGNEIYSVDIDDLIGFIDDDDTIYNIVDLIDEEGVKALVNDIISAVTKFETAAAAVEAGEAIYETQITYSNWTLEINHAGCTQDNRTEDAGEDDDYLTVGIGESEETYSVTFSIVIDGDDDDMEAVTDLFDGLAELMGDDGVSIEISDLDISYDSATKTFSLDAQGEGEVYVDMSSDPVYAAIFAVIIAENTSNVSIKNSLIEGIKDLLDDNDVSTLQEAVNDLTTAQVISAFTKWYSSDEISDYLADLGLSDYEEEISETVSIYKRVIDLIAWTARQIGISGSGKTMEEVYDEETEYYTFFSKENASYSYESGEIKGYSADVSFTLTSGYIGIKLFGEGQEPEWNGNDPEVTTGNVIAGYDVVEDDGTYYLILDVKPEGISWDEFLELVDFSDTADYADTVYAPQSAPSGTTQTTYVYDESDGNVSIINGAVVTVTAENEYGSITMDYTVIILGDVNANGISDVADCTSIVNHIIGAQTISTTVGLLAANINCTSYDGASVNGVEIADAVRIQSKIVNWNGYETLLGADD